MNALPVVMVRNEEYYIGRVLAPLDEVASPPTAQANHAIIFAQDNGAGKTQLMVQFSTGAAVQIAIEP